MRLSNFSWAALPLMVTFTPQAVPAADEHDAPIYRITVVQRTLAAVNYGHRSLPTKVDFRGTVLAPETHGNATIESKAGAVLVHAKLGGLGSAAQFRAPHSTFLLRGHRS